MKYKKEDIHYLVKRVNESLSEPTIKSTRKACEIIGIPFGTLQKWSSEAGYVYDNSIRQYVKANEKEHNTETKKSTNKNTVENKIDMDKLNELIGMLEPLKELIAEHNESITKVNEVELNPPSITNVKQKLFKIDVDILDDWEQFVQDHKQFKIQNLISLALKEFIEKYK